jgi:hypothetical protein
VTDAARIRSRLAERLFGGRLLMNSVRGDWVEEMVALALEPDWRLCSGDWAGWDLELADGLRMQVRQSAALQSWGTVTARPRFSIAPVTGYWREDGVWTPCPGRIADLYLFAWHGRTDEGADHREPAEWRFHAVPETALPAQRSIGLAALGALAPATSLDDLRRAVAAAADAIPPSAHRAGRA